MFLFLLIMALIMQLTWANDSLDSVRNTCNDRTVLRTKGWLKTYP